MWLYKLTDVVVKIGWLDPTILQKPELLKVRRRFYLYVFDLGLMERYCCLLSLLVQYVFLSFCKDLGEVRDTATLYGEF